MPMSIAAQIAIIWAGTTGHLDDIAVANISRFESGFLGFLDRSHKKLLGMIAKEKALTPDIESGLTKGIAEFKKSFS